MFSRLKKRARIPFLIQLRVQNLKRLRIATRLGLVMAVALLGLDFVRYSAGNFEQSSLYLYLFINHLSLFVLIIPLLIVYLGGEAVAKGRHRFSYFLIVSWTAYISLITLVMAILSVIERGSIAMYAINIMVVNFVIILPHAERILLNVCSYVIFCCAIVFIQGDVQEMMIVNFLEATGVAILAFVVSTNLYNNAVRRFNNERALKEKNEAIKTEKDRSYELLLNILPEKIADELIIYKKVQPRDYSSATVMITDFKEFSKKSNFMTTGELVHKIDYCFSAFDQIISKYDLEKIKTLGDGYLCVGGVPMPSSDHPEKVIHAAVEILDFLAAWKKECIAKNEQYFEGRVGIHTGPLIAGVVGKSKFAFDIWGDTVNIAARLESNGEAGRINISKPTYQLVENLFECTHRGKIPIKNQDPIDMYFIENEKTQLT